MSDPAVHVEAARIPDRDRLLELLREHGLDARPVDEVEIEVSSTDDAEAVSDEVFQDVERLILEVGATFVPQKHEGVIYIRPPVS
jgi:hypothetical protein